MKYHFKPTLYRKESTANGHVTGTTGPTANGHITGLTGPTANGQVATINESYTGKCSFKPAKNTHFFSNAVFLLSVRNITKTPFMQREREREGTIGFFITLVPKVFIITFSYSLT